MELMYAEYLAGFFMEQSGDSNKYSWKNRSVQSAGMDFG